MKRLHLHVSVTDLDQAIQFYNTLFAQEADVVKDDYAKWLVDDPAINFAISNHGEQAGLSHLGLQVDNDEQLKEIESRLTNAGIQGMPEENTHCCYANSNKYWTRDPANIAWENFHTMEARDTYYADNAESPVQVPENVQCCR